MDKKFLLRMRNAGLYDIEQAKLARLAQRGWLPQSISRSVITLKKSQPQNLKCRMLFYDTAEPSYNRYMTELQNSGWRYVSSDGVSQTLLTAPEGTEDIVNPEAECKVLRRHRTAQGILAFICFAALIILTAHTIREFKGIPINRIFTYGTILAYGIHCVACCISNTRSMLTVTGEAEPRSNSMAEIVHTALLVLTGVMLALAITAALCYN